MLQDIGMLCTCKQGSLGTCTLWFRRARVDAFAATVDDVRKYVGGVLKLFQGCRSPAAAVPNGHTSIAFLQTRICCSQVASCATLNIGCHKTQFERFSNLYKSSRLVFVRNTPVIQKSIKANDAKTGLARCDSAWLRNFSVTIHFLFHSRLLGS